MFSRPKILFLVSLLFVALLNPKFNPYLLFKFLICIPHSIASLARPTQKVGLAKKFTLECNSMTYIIIHISILTKQWGRIFRVSCFVQSSKDPNGALYGKISGL